ncbi:hypothetical protein [Saccharopolyspora thermophila]|uniref:hypothetical protein n=1 Tax=Saccharopolyspora thermophila TaxID=89367 RepID=UPI001E29E993|nr:hypothetical protein [Saccharopolyspora subtropica]
MISRAHPVISNAGSAHWAANRDGSSVIHLTASPDDVAPLCGFVFPPGATVDVCYGYLPGWWMYGYVICWRCETRVAVDLDEIAEVRRPLSVDELPTAVIPVVRSGTLPVDDAPTESIPLAPAEPASMSPAADTMEAEGVPVTHRCPLRAATSRADRQQSEATVEFGNPHVDATRPRHTCPVAGDGCIVDVPTDLIPVMSHGTNLLELEALTALGYELGHGVGSACLPGVSTKATVRVEAPSNSRRVLGEAA